MTKSVLYCHLSCHPELVSGSQVISEFIVASTLVVVRRLRFQFLLDTGGVDNDSCLSIDGALVLTNATACALFFLDDRTLLLVTHDRLIGTLFVADEADLLSIPGNASGLVNMSDTHLDEAFFFNGER